MADGTVFLHRRMLPDPRAAFVSVAGVAELVGTLSGNHGFIRSTVGIVTIGTGHLTLNNWMVRQFIGIGTDIPMAVETNCGLQNSGTRLVNAVTGSTAHPILLVSAHLPESQLGPFLMAVQTTLGLLIRGLQRRRTKGYYCFFARVVLMYVCAAMAGFTA